MKGENPLKYYKIRFEDRQAVIKLLIPKNTPLFDAMIWKTYAYENKIWDFFKTIRQHPIVLVGADHYHNFGDIANLPNYQHIPIHDTKASVERWEVLKIIEETHHQLQNSPYPPIYFFVAGSVSVWWVYHIHKILENKFLIDVGQAFNFLYPSRQGLLHREFGYSKEKTKQRKVYKTSKLYGTCHYDSKMTIENNQVDFRLNLKWTDIWLEKLLVLIQERTIRRKLMKWRYSIQTFLSKIHRSSNK